MGIEETKRQLKLIREGYIEETNSDILHEMVFEGVASALLGIMFACLGMDRKQTVADKAKMAKLKLDADEKKKKREEYLKTKSVEALVSDIKKDAKKLVAELKSNKSAIKEINTHIKKHVEYKEQDLSYKLVFKDEGDYIEIIDAGQDVKIALHWLIHDIITTLEVKYAEPVSLGVVSISGGDGDEGCLYVD